MSSFLETSLLIRYLTKDVPEKADRCERLFREAQKGRIILYLTPLVVAETIWVLSSVYRFQKAEIVEGMRRVLNTPHLICDDQELILQALELFRTRPISFIDAYHAAFMEHHGISTVYSYDTDFDGLTGITRREP